MRASEDASRLPARTGTTTPIALIAFLLLAIIAISGFSVQLLEVQRSVLEEAIRESRAVAMNLLANRVEQALSGALRAPFMVLKNVPLKELDTARLRLLARAFPELEEVLVLDSDLRVRATFPEVHGERSLADAWLARHVVSEKERRQGKVLPPTSFVETVDGNRLLFAIAPLNEMTEPEGWVILRYNVAALEDRYLTPLLREFNSTQGGFVTTLQPPEAGWDEELLHRPLSPVLPGWMLVSTVDPALEARELARGRALIAAEAGAVLLAMTLAIFAVWREIQRARALAALRSRFVANVSHELRTPLTLIRMYAETLDLGRVTDERRRHEYYRTILSESERLTEMVDRVLDFSRRSHGGRRAERRATDLRATVAEVLSRYSPRVEAQGLRLEANLASDLPAVAHDPDGVTQILLNLIDNAVKYGGDGGLVEVRLAARGIDWVDLAVTDHGPGMEEGERAILHKELQRGRGLSRAQGVGLGLALVDEIARSHGAKLALDPAPGRRGLEARVSFPLRSSGP